MKAAREDLVAMRAEADSIERSRALAASRSAVERWAREHPGDLESALDWIEELRRVFGDPPVDRTPWRGGDFRL
jgi:hypothetical protein